MMTLAITLPLHIGIIISIIIVITVLISIWNRVYDLQQTTNEYNKIIKQLLTEEKLKHTHESQPHIPTQEEYQQGLVDNDTKKEKI